jgi:hypothetical protein
MFQENRFCNDGTHTSRASNSDHGNNDVEKNQHQVAHSRMLTDEKVSYFRVIRNSPGTALQASISGSDAHFGCGNDWLWISALISSMFSTGQISRI